MRISNGRFVVGVDGSSESREALRWASRLAATLGGEIVAVHALGLLESIGGRPVPAHRYRAEVVAKVEEGLGGALRRSGTRCRVIVRDGSPIDVLPAVAREEAASLVVVGTRGIGSAPALALGSTSLHLLQVTPVPVLVVPRSEEAASHLGLRRILVGISAGIDPTAAIEISGELAVAIGSCVELVHAVDDMPVFPLGPAARVSIVGETEACERARERLEPLGDQLGAMGVPVHTTVRRGPPTEQVRAVAAAIDADLLVLTSAHVGSPAEPLLATSVSRQIVGLTHRPTLVVPARPSVAQWDQGPGQQRQSALLRRPA